MIFNIVYILCGVALGEVLHNSSDVKVVTIIPFVVIFIITVILEYNAKKSAIF